MFTLTLHDERVYKRLMEKVEQRGESLDEVLGELLDQSNETSQTMEAIEDNQEETPAQKLLRLIDESDLAFTYPLNGSDVEDFLSKETGEITWREVKDDDGSAQGAD